MNLGCPWRKQCSPELQCGIEFNVAPILCRLGVQSGNRNAGQKQYLQTEPPGDSKMGKGNNSQKNDKNSMKPKQDKKKPAVKK